MPAQAASLKAARPANDLGLLARDLEALAGQHAEPAALASGQAAPGTLGHVLAHPDLGERHKLCASLSPTVPRELLVLAAREAHVTRLFGVLHAVAVGTALGVVSAGQLVAHRLSWNAAACDGAYEEMAHIAILDDGKTLQIDGTSVSLSDDKLAPAFSADAHLKSGLASLRLVSWGKLTVGQLMAVLDAMADAGARAVELDDSMLTARETESETVRLGQVDSEAGRDPLEVERVLRADAVPRLRTCHVAEATTVEVAFHVDAAGKVNRLAAGPIGKGAARNASMGVVEKCIMDELGPVAFPARTGNVGISLVLDFIPPAQKYK
jgi:hypothetical protein